MFWEGWGCRSHGSHFSDQFNSCFCKGKSLLLRSRGSTQLVHDQAQSPNITLVPVSLPLNALRTHVRASANRSLRKLASLNEFPRYPEIRQLYFASSVDENICGFDIPMNLVMLVEIRQATQDLQGYLSCDCLIDFRLYLGGAYEFEDIVKRANIHQFQDHLDLSLIVICPVESYDATATVAPALLLDQIVQQNPNVIHYLMALVLVVDIYRLSKPGTHLNRNSLIQRLVYPFLHHTRRPPSQHQLALRGEILLCGLQKSTDMFSIDMHQSVRTNVEILLQKPESIAADLRVYALLHF